MDYCRALQPNKRQKLFCWRGEGLALQPKRLSALKDSLYSNAVLHTAGKAPALCKGGLSAKPARNRAESGRSAVITLLLTHTLCL